ncbi:hypothetical protein [Tardiphaga sp. P5_C7]
MALLLHMTDAPALRPRPEFEVTLSEAVVDIIGNAAQLVRIKQRLSDQLDTMKQIAELLADEDRKKALILLSDQRRTELEHCFRALSEATQELPRMHNQLVSQTKRHPRV